MARILSPAFAPLRSRRLWYLPLIGLVTIILFYSYQYPSSIPIPQHRPYPIAHDNHRPPVRPPPPLPPPPPPPPPPKEVEKSVWTERAQLVRQAFLHSYLNYEKYALPHDELKPLSKGHSNPFNGWGVTLVDSLDTMWLMGLKDEFKRAKSFVEKMKFEMGPNDHAPYFETTIRYVGGLLSAYALSEDPVFLNKVDELAEKLEPVFKTGSGLPAFGVNTVNGHIERDQTAVLAEIGSFQLEYLYLAKVTGKRKYYNHVKNSQKIFTEADLSATGGMLPVHWNLANGKATDTSVSVGGEADSGHEYLLKMYLLSAQTDKTSLEMYIRTTTYILTNLMFMTEKRHLLYVTKASGASTNGGGRPAHNAEHLGCFLPGLLAVGAHTLPLDDLPAAGLPKSLLELLPPNGRGSHAEDGYRSLSTYSLKDVHLWAADGLGQTCYLLYADQASGLGPENAGMKVPADHKPAIRWIDMLDAWKKSGGRGAPPGTNPIKPVKGSSEEKDYYMHNAIYILRPETMESMYMLWKVTGDNKWRERGWEMFQALEKNARTEIGYANLQSVEREGPNNHMDSQPSYFLAEALKYLYLLFDEQPQLSLREWVYSTEAHPFPVFHWTDEEKLKFGI